MLFIGYLVLKGQTNSLTDTNNNRIINAGIFRNIAGGSSGGGAVAQTLNDLSDVIITTPTNYQALVYDSGNWINGTPLNATSASFATTATTASYVLNAVSSSFASTSSFVQNAQSASYALNATSASYVLNSTSASYALNATSASFADNAINATTASYILNAVSASYALNATSASYALNATSASYALNSTTASYALNSTSASYALNSTSASYALNATSASYAATASHANSGFSIGLSQIQTATVASSIVGANNLFTDATGSYTAAKYLYTVTNGANARTGEVIAVWNGGSVQFTDNSTLDIGSTAAVTASVAIVTSQAQFNIQTNTSGWTIKSQVTYI